MNTKTMRLPPRRLLTPTKRKERNDFDAPKPAPTKRSLKPATPPQIQAGSEKSESKLDSSNQLLAGYLANEYLTKGTLFGQPFDPARSQAVKPPAKVAKPPGKRGGAAGEERGADEEEEEEEEEEEGKNRRRYVEVASLLKTDGAHIVGIVNPTQLARFLHM